MEINPLEDWVRGEFSDLVARLTMVRSDSIPHPNPIHANGKMAKETLRSCP